MDGLGEKCPPSLGCLFKPAEFLHQLLNMGGNECHLKRIVQAKLIKSVKSYQMQMLNQMLKQMCPDSLLKMVCYYLMVLNVLSFDHLTDLTLFLKK